jgi:3-hydroxyacyl-[acyl-carrier-protein] dehydratase
MTDLGFIDRILEVKEDSIIAQKNLTINEDYLLDHFAEYPVMPGVLMTQALLEAASWWLRHKTGFRAAQISLKDLKNARFANFLKPGDILRIEVVNKVLSEHEAVFQAKGKREEKNVLSMRFTLNYAAYCDILDKKDSAIFSDKEKSLFNTLIRSPEKQT